MKSLLTGIFVIACCLAAKAVTHTVALGGNIQDTINLAAAGDTVIVQPGVYPISQTISINKSLTLLGAGAVLDAIGWNAGLNGKRILTISDTHDVLVEGFTLRNLIGFNGVGLLITGQGHHITVRNCRLENISWTATSPLTAIPTDSALHETHAILVHGTQSTALSHIYIDADTITNCGTGFSESLTVAGNVDSFWVTRNYVYANGNIGIDIAGHTTFFQNPPGAVNFARNGFVRGNTVFRCMSPVRFSGGIYLDGAYNCEVSGNTLYENAVGISVGCERLPAPGAQPCSRNRVINNQIYRNAVAGVYWGNSDSAGVWVVANRLSNNLLFGNRTGEMINGVASVAGIPAGTGDNDFGSIFGGEIMLHNNDSSRITNNIVMPWGYRRCMVFQPGDTSTNFSSRYNDWHHDTSGGLFFVVNENAIVNGIVTQGNHPVNHPGLDQFSISQYPDFVDTAANNFQLDDGSPCINTGDPASTVATCGAVDLDSNTRFVGTIDMGAFEAAASSGVAPAAQRGFAARLYPNPAGSVVYVQAGKSVALVEVLDMAGRLMIQAPGPAGALDVTPLPPGLYQVRVREARGGVWCGKLVKQ